MLYYLNNNINTPGGLKVKNMLQEEFDAEFEEDRAIFVQLEDQEPLSTLTIEDEEDLELDLDDEEDETEETNN